uniref:Uncharacterized protein n=1 Tax=Rhizophora mucronata TaxID=61149 RepID=A0A2P2QIQ5_RHIMU
MEEKIGNCVQI